MNIFQATQKGPLKVPGYIDPNDVTTVTVYWGAPIFAAATVYREGDICRPTTDNGYYYQCTVNGVSGTEPATWSQTKQVSGTAAFVAVPYDLWVLPGETLVGVDLILASTWTATNSVVLSSSAYNSVSTSVVIQPLPVGVTEFELTNQVRKSNGERLSRTFKYKVNEQ
jgi:hypothetical protein